jgi:predicted Zn-dependent protease
MSASSKRLETFAAMLKVRPGDPFVHYAHAMELRSLGRKDEALAALVEVTRTFAAYVPSYLMAAQLAAELGDVARARTLAKAGIDAAQSAGDGHATSELMSFAATLEAE